MENKSVFGKPFTQLFRERTQYLKDNKIPIEESPDNFSGIPDYWTDEELDGWIGKNAKKNKSALKA